MEAQLEELAARIHRLAREPESIGGHFRFLSWAFHRLFRREPKLSVERTTALLDAMRKDGEQADIAPHVQAALDELEENVEELERAAITDGSPPAAHLLWLWRLHGVVGRAARVASPDDSEGRRVAGRLDPRTLSPPVIAAGRVTDASSAAPMAPVELVEALLDAARAETDHLGRRRRLLETARRTLLEAGAAVTLDAKATAARQEWIAREIQAIDRFEVGGVSTTVGLLHQARGAASRGDARVASEAVRALDRVAASAGDITLGRLTDRALTAMGARRAADSPELRRGALAAVARRAFGAEVDDAIGRAYEEARDDLEVRIRRSDGLVRENLEHARSHLKSEAALEQLLSTFGVDAAVEVGGVTTPLRVLEESRTLRAVRHPTDHMILMNATSPADVVDAVIVDPRAVLLHLAEGRLLSRRYVAEEVRRRAKVKLATEVRVYLLDASTSMLGPRARMRDAIILAELLTLRSRLLDSERYYDPVLYYRYFTKKPWETRRVATPSDCLSAVSEVVETVRIGETDIERALLASFEQIKDAEAHDQRLARASIVLVTDGEADVDHELVWNARMEVGSELPVRLNIVALGLENPALESLAARQRARGEEVFYQFLSDDFLESVIAGFPDEERFDWLPETGTASTSRELHDLLDEIHGLERARDVEALAELDAHRTTLEFMGVDLDAMSDGERARLEAMHRHRRALMHRFERWFPQPAPRVTLPEEPARGTQADQSLAEVLAALVAVAETVDAVGSRGLQRQADAVELLERILVQSGISPHRYGRICREQAPHLARALADVRRAAHVDGERPAVANAGGR